MSWLVKIPETLFVLAVPFFILSASVAWAVNDEGLYQQGFDDYNISLRTEISRVGLRAVGADIRRYFNSSEEPLSVRAKVCGEDRDLFTPREVTHMRDVKVLIQRVYLVMQVAGAFLVAGVIGGLIWYRGSSPDKLALLFNWGGWLTLGLIMGVGSLALIGFDALFLRFHQIFFSNDFWQLDPRTDYLIILFPQGFWFDATMRVALTALAGGLGLVGVSALFLAIRWWFGPNRSYWRRSGNPELLRPDAPDTPSPTDPWR